MKKILMLVVCCCMLWSVAKAQTITTPFDGADFTAVLSELRANWMVTTEKNTYAGGHMPIISYRPTGLYTLVNLNAGVSWATKGGVRSFAPSLTLRVDGVLDLIAGYEWSKKHLTMARLPAIEIGPFISCMDFDDRPEYGIVFAVRTGLGGS